MKSHLTTFIFGVGLLIPACFGLLLSGAPTVICPLPFLTVMPGFLLSSWDFRAAVFVPVLAFFLWNPRLFRGYDKIPKRSYGLLAVVTAISVVWFVGGWRYGLRYQGAYYTYFVCGINLVWIASLWTMFTHKWKSGASSFKANLLLHWTLFAWLSWYALPYLGELP